MQGLMDLGGGVGWIGTLIIGGLAGWIAEKVMKADHGDGSRTEELVQVIDSHGCSFHGAH